MLKQRVLPPTDENPDPAITQYDYNTRGELERVTNARSETTEFTYDDAGRLRFRKDANDNTTEFTWDELGRLKKTIDPLNRVKERFYRQDGVVDFIRQADGTEIHFEYDLYGNRTALIDPNDNRTEFRYDGNNRLIEQIDPLDKSTFYEYDAVGNVTKITDRLNRVRLFEYDALDRLVKETWVSPTGEVVKEIEMAYDAAGNLVGTADDVSDYAMTYDNRNRVDVITAKYPGQDDFILDHDYDDANRMSVVTDNAGVSVTSITDARGQLRTLLWQGAPAGPARVEMGYNQLGDMTNTHRYKSLSATMSDLVFKTDYAFGRGKTDIGAFANSYNQSAQNALDQLLSTEGFGPLDIQPDTANVMLNGTDQLSRMTHITHRRMDESILSAYEYLYDDANQLDEETANGENIDYDYDLIDQLEGAARSAFNAEVYRYDDSGNRLRTDDQATDSIIEDGNRIVSDGIHTYAYDDEGNRISKTEISTRHKWAYTYDHRNRMIEARQETDSGSLITSVTFMYDGLNRRIEKASEGHSIRYTYLGEMIWAKADSAGVEYYLSPGIDQWLARSGTDSVEWYATDRMGTARSVVDSTGSAIAERTYSSYGEIIADTNPIVMGEIGFTGREYDLETGFYYYRARYYDSAIGNFISEDPIGFEGGDYNLSRNVFNAPTSYIDPMGTSPSVTRQHLHFAARKISMGVQYFALNTYQYLYFAYNIAWRSAYISVALNSQRIYLLWRIFFLSNRATSNSIMVAVTGFLFDRYVADVGEWIEWAANYLLRRYDRQIQGLPRDPYFRPPDSGG